MPPQHPAHPFQRPISRRSLIARGALLAGAAAVATPTSLMANSRRRAAVADLVITGGRVVSVDNSIPKASAVAISGGKLLVVGTDADALATSGPATEVIDARGATVMPGIHDGHIHPFSGGQLLTAPTLNYAQLDVAQFRKRIARILRQTAAKEPDGWLDVSLWDATAMDELPTRRDLDSLDTKRPIIVTSTDGHIALANSRALALAGIDASTKDPPGGEIRQGGSGEPTGVLLDDAIYLVYGLVPKPTAEENADSLAAGYELMAKSGITSCLHAAADEQELAAIATLADRGPLPLRAHLSVTVDGDLADDPAAMLAEAERLRSTYARPGFEIDTLKMFFDGVIEYPTQTAALLEPYLVNEGSEKNPKWVEGKDRGPTYWAPKVAKAAVAAADAAGWRVHFHAIGDRAVRDSLDAVEAAIGANGRSDNRHTITHLELVDPADFRRFKRLGVLASMQMQWAERDSYTVERLRDYLGPKRYRNVYPAGSLKKAGALLCGGSDWPVDPLYPMRQIEMAVNRTADEIYAGEPEPLFKTQGLSLPASIAMHTRNSAYQLHQESITGRLRPGMDADLVVLDRDINKVPLTKVSKAKSRLTLVQGRTTHRSDI